MLGCILSSYSSNPTVPAPVAVARSTLPGIFWLAPGTTVQLGFIWVYGRYIIYHIQYHKFSPYETPISYMVSYMVNISYTIYICIYHISIVSISSYDL